MKKFKKLLSLSIIFVMILVLAKIPVYAAPPVPVSTSVTIHKVVGTSLLGLQNHDGSQLTPEQIAALGTNSVEDNTGVQFTAWPVPTGTSVNTFDGMSDAQVTASPIVTGTPVVVDAGVAHSFSNGTYYVRETLHPATLKYQMGVPFIMELPALNVNGDAYLAALHLYPKDIIDSDLPEIDKDVEAKDQDNAGYDVGETFDYLIYPKVPDGIQSYSAFKVADTLQTTLDYMNNISVIYHGASGAITLIATTDYTIESDATGTAGGGFTLTFTKAGLQKLADNRPSNQTLKDLEIKFQARMNRTATMGTSIYNNSTLTYNNGYTPTDQTAEVALAKRPEVHTGGRQFVKVESITNQYNTNLASASFVVKNGAGQYMAKDSVGNVSWVSTVASATKINVDGLDGSFEVTGLAYSDNGSPLTYRLEEVNVPTGYVKMDDLNFTIDSTSYGNSTDITDNTKVTNVKRPIIPQTGGIGAIIFLAVGLTLMGVAVVTLKKRKQIKKVEKQ